MAQMYYITKVLSLIAWIKNLSKLCCHDGIKLVNKNISDCQYCNIRYDKKCHHDVKLRFLHYVSISLVTKSRSKSATLLGTTVSHH